MLFLFLLGIWGGPAGIPPAFKPFWLVHLNAQIGPTPQQPSPR